MQFQQLVYFVAVAETRHFTRAAERAHVAQPSLSKQIRALERELGAELFTRARGNIDLTPAGERLLPLARRILADADTARLEVAELVGLRSGRVRVGATPSLSTSVLPEVLLRFHTAYPGIRLVVSENGSRDLLRLLLRGALDLALVVVPPQGTDPALATEPLLREELVLATSAATAPPTRGGALPVARLRTMPLVMFRDGYDVREAVLRACRGNGFEPAFAVEGGEMDAVLRLVEAGLGPAVVPSMVLAGVPGLRATRLVRPGLTRTIALAHRTDAALTHAARALRTVLLESLADAGPLPSGVERLAARP
ncbi:LysR family transcriptional regulator [Allostreptomyces psammosilenae]|uniref:DNA-binding transcriptional LysR family regulator n=1 Tax=Allostreptomyces psammosilenae TaxID=1892865 RepID=A0A852ZS48_9ACTN|nr:LysR substrate-binding domain-containing protein [Allostreptomyces psammosilenae]NYI03674.1 DNA-binding transcriptional LysR family regulator [Allostreptomyces psammosilenae]